MTRDVAGPAPLSAPSGPAALLRALGLRPRKRLSQTFLTDPAIARVAAEAVEVGPHDVVLEPGPGLGLLTTELLQRAGRVVAVERDAELAEALRRRYAGEALEVVVGNVLGFDPRAHGLGQYLLVSNLPYQISSPFLSRFLVDVPPPLRMVLMLQREVAERLVGRQGELSYLGVQTQLLAEARLVRRVPSGAFYPRPRVESALVRLDPRPQPAAGVADVRGFLTLTRAGFAQPRKQLRNSLAQGLGWEPVRAGRLIDAAELDPTWRPQELAVADWARLHAEYRRSVDGSD